MEADEFELSSGEDEQVTRFQTADETFLHRAQCRAAGEADADVGIGGNGADRHPVLLDQALVIDGETTVFESRLLIARVGSEGPPAT